MQYSLWYVVPNTLPVGTLVTEELRYQITDRQRIGYNIPQAVLRSLKFLKIGKIVARNMSSCIGFINKPLLLHLFGFFLYHRPVVLWAVRICMTPAIFCCILRGFSCTMLLGVIFIRPCWNLRFRRSCCVVLVTSMTPSCGMDLRQHVRTIREKLWWRARDDQNCFTASLHFSDRRQRWTFLGQLASASVFAAS